MLRLIWNASIRIRTFMRVWMPTNILLDALRTRRGLRWGVPAMLLAAGYFAIAYWCTTLIDAGAPGGLHLIVLLRILNAFKFLIHGPISLVRLIQVRHSEHRQARIEASERRATPQRTPRVPAEHEALPQHEHGPTHLGRTAAAHSA